MFEKFTQKAISIIQIAQDRAGSLGHNIVYSEHILLGAISEAKGVDARIFENAGLNFTELEGITLEKLDTKPKYPLRGEIPFSKSAKLLLEKAIEIYETFQSPLIMPQHIYLALVSTKGTGAYAILKEYESDNKIIIANFEKLIAKKKTNPEETHPEAVEKCETQSNYDPSMIFYEDKVKSIFENAVSKLSTCGYEILGTEQIFQSILESNNDAAEILSKYGIDRETFASRLQGFSNRDEEYGGKKIIFTPNAFRAMLLAIDAAKENGSVEINPEYLILGILRSKTGIAYQIIKDFIPPGRDFEDAMVKHSPNQPLETLSILRFAKNEAQAMGKSTIGTDLILLGILSYTSGIGAKTLSKLGITLKDAREEVKKQMGSEISPWQQGASVKNFVYTDNAKRLLEIAWQTAKKHNKPKIMSENLLYAIVKQPDCVAMKVLTALGTDVVEVAQGIVHQLYA